MTQRKGPVGLGYLPKGGRPAGAAHNRRVLPAAAAGAASTAAADGCTDARVSASAGHTSAQRVGPWLTFAVGLAAGLDLRVIVGWLS